MKYLPLLAILLCAEVAQANESVLPVPDPAQWLDSGSLHSALYKRLPGESQWEYEPDSPARNSEHSIRLRLLNTDDPTLAVRSHAGPVGFALIAKGRRSSAVDSLGRYSLRELDNNNDGIFEAQEQSFEELSSGDITLLHRQQVWFALSVSLANWTIGGNGLFMSGRTRGSPTQALLYWPEPVTLGSTYARSQTKAEDLARSATLGGAERLSQSLWSEDRSLAAGGFWVSWHSTMSARLLAALGKESSTSVGSSLLAVTQSTGGSLASSEISESRSDRSSYTHAWLLGDFFYPARVGFGARLSWHRRSQNSNFVGHRRGAIKENSGGIVSGQVAVSRDRVFEWQDRLTLPLRSDDIKVRLWMRAEPYGLSQVGEWLLGVDYRKQTSESEREELLTSTVRDTVDNGNNVDDTGDLFKRGEGSSRFALRNIESGERFTLWSRVASTMLEDSQLVLGVQTGYQWYKTEMTRVLLSQTPVVGTTNSAAGTTDHFQEPAAFSDLPTSERQVRGSLFANLGLYFHWQPEDPIGINFFLELNPLAGTGLTTDVNATSDWLSRFGAEAAYTF